MRLLVPGEYERFKGHYHRALLGLVAGAALYNATRFSLSHEPHSALNALVYTAAIWWETHHVNSHATRVELDEGDRRRRAGLS